MNNAFLRWSAVIALVLSAAAPLACKKDGVSEQTKRSNAPRAEPEPARDARPRSGDAVAPADAGTGATEEDNVVRVDVESASELANVKAKHRELRRSGEDATLEVVLAPGEYERVSLQLSDRIGSNVAVILRGSANGAVILRQARLDVRGSRVELKDLVFHREFPDSIAAHVAVTDEAVLERLAFVDHVVRDPEGQGSLSPTGVVAMEALSGGASATVRDTWFARTRPGERTPLVEARSPRHGFGEIHFERVAFASVDRGPGVRARGPVTFASSVRLGGQESPEFATTRGANSGVKPPDFGDSPTAADEAEIERLAAALLRGEQPEPPGGW